MIQHYNSFSYPLIECEFAFRSFLRFKGENFGLVVLRIIFPNFIMKASVIVIIEIFMVYNPLFKLLLVYPRLVETILSGADVNI